MRRSLRLAPCREAVWLGGRWQVSWESNDESVLADPLRQTLPQKVQCKQNREHGSRVDRGRMKEAVDQAPCVVRGLGPGVPRGALPERRGDQRGGRKEGLPGPLEDSAGHSCLHLKM